MPRSIWFRSNRSPDGRDDDEYPISVGRLGVAAALAGLVVFALQFPSGGGLPARPTARDGRGLAGRRLFLWSAKDNFEWGDGFCTRFGIIYVDFNTQQHSPELSAKWFRETARRNAVV